MKLKRTLASLVLAAASCAMAWSTNVIVDGTHVRLRMAPSTEGKIVEDAPNKPHYVNKGDVLPYLGTSGNFYKVKFDGKVVYVSRDYSHLSDAATPAPAAKKATGALTAMDKKLVGKHPLSLQWISWDYFGSVNITKESDNYYHCVGQQLDRDHAGDYVKIDGYISAVDDKNLIFNGTIAIKIYHINGGQEYVRDGEFNFKSTQGRKYWRMQEMEGPDGETDYVDIYMKLMGTGKKK